MAETLQLNRIIRREQKHVCIADQRRRVNYVLADYRDSEGNEYRKSFESYDDPIVPESGTHSELNKMARQFEPPQLGGAFGRVISVTTVG